MPSKKACFISIIASCIFSTSLANNYYGNILEQLNNSYAINFALSHLNYREFFTPAEIALGVKSTEHGTIFGTAADFRLTINEVIYNDLYLDLFSGKIKYDGASREADENGYYPPIIYKYPNTFFNLVLTEGYIFSWRQEPTFQVIPFVGIGYRYWDRQGAREEYYNYKAIAGVKSNWAVTECLAFSPYFSAGTTFGARMKHKEDGLFILGGKPIYEAGLEINYRVADEMFLNFFVAYTHLEYGESAVKEGSNLREPHSKTTEIKYGIGLRCNYR